MERTGRCMCGAVTYTASLEPTVSACHCGMCRRWAGGPFLTAGPAEVEFAGRENMTVIESSAWAERGFCNKCGSSLFYRLTGGRYAGVTHVGFGTLDDQSGFEMVREWFCDLKPDAYAFEGEHDRVTSEEIEAMFSGALGEGSP